MVHSGEDSDAGVPHVEAFLDLADPWSHVAAHLLVRAVDAGRLIVDVRLFEIDPAGSLRVRSVAEMFGDGDPARAERALDRVRGAARDHDVRLEVPTEVPSTAAAAAALEAVRSEGREAHLRSYLTCSEELWAGGVASGRFDASREFTDVAGAEAVTAHARRGRGLGVRTTPTVAVAGLLVPGIPDVERLRRLANGASTASS